MQHQEEALKLVPEWTDPPSCAPENLKALMNEVKGLHPIVARILYNRGYRNFAAVRSFMRPAENASTNIPEMKGMKTAVSRIGTAVRNDEKILVYGDYDVDGTCSTAVMYTFLKSLKAKVEYYNPDRYAEGYGISKAGVEYAAHEGFGLVIALDCGIAAVDRIAEAKNLGVDFIVCDHHMPGEVLPPAVAILNPKQKDCALYGEELCGCGVAFLLIRALCRHFNLNEEHWKAALPLVAVATCCDIVDLTGLNRSLVMTGLQLLNKTPPPGISAMLKKAAYAGTLDVSDVVFKIGPRINAAGRLAHAREAVQLLTQKDVPSAMPFAERLEELNRERRILDKEVTALAVDLMRDYDPDLTASATVVKSDGWHKGVIGITASRLTEVCYRPTVVFTEIDGMLTGSARSIEGFDLFKAVKDCAELLTNYGGHRSAAGMSLKAENFEAFRSMFEAAVARGMGDLTRRPKLYIDVEADFEDWHDEHFKGFFNQLNRLKPYGPKNREPVFATRRCSAADVRVVGTEHLKFKVYQEGSKAGRFPVIAFRCADLYDRLVSGARFDMAYTVGSNHWNGVTSFQLEAKDITNLSED
ncbi:MAG: single-stranded-DNA-specific exonuclease RecJ [Cryomorphaceae bacterium]|nr:single-stranded-DNA-specific exonuclease RecJ [Flavobacteriales bacterium]